MDKSKIEKVQPEQMQISERKVDGNSISPAFANALVVCSQSPSTLVETINKEDVSKLVFDKPLNVGTVTLYEQELKYCPPFGQSPPT